MTKRRKNEDVGLDEEFNPEYELAEYEEEWEDVESPYTDYNDLDAEIDSEFEQWLDEE